MHVLDKVHQLRPDVVMTYKGNSVCADLLAAIRKCGVCTVNVYPDLSPHAHGEAHRKAVGAYDLVISTKSFHPELWQEVYGYTNKCRFVPQGYDPELHLVCDPPSEFSFDVVMVATYRPEYGRLMIDLADALGGPDIRMAIGGFGWEACSHLLPKHWQFPGPVSGRGYVSLLRHGKICIAPLTRDVVINGRHQPGDVDTTRSYELAAAHCFFIHRRTEFSLRLYGAREVPMFDDGVELAGHIHYFLAHEEERYQMAAAAHRRAVPAYSLDERAKTIVALLKDELVAHDPRDKPGAVGTSTGQHG